MTVTNIATHYACLQQVYNKYNISCPSQILNLDETGFCLRGATRTRTKLIEPEKKRANATSIKISGDLDHVTVMPVVSADGKSCNPAVSLKGKRRRVRKISNGSSRTLHGVFPTGSHIEFWKAVESMDSEIFALWARDFVLETEDLRRRKRNLLVILDRFDARCKYNAMKTLRDTGVIVISIIAHMLYALQPLNLSVFASTKIFSAAIVREDILYKTKSRQ